MCADWLPIVMKTFPQVKCIIYKRRTHIEARMNTAGALMRVHVTNFP